MSDMRQRVEITNKIHKIWEENPELRYFQLLTIILSPFSGTDPFYLEDSELEKRLDEILSTGVL